MLTFDDLVAFYDLTPEQREVIASSGVKESLRRLGEAAEEGKGEDGSGDLSV